jgi:hypothetical protein
MNTIILTKKNYNRVAIAAILAFITLILTGCESPADVDADRKIIREYDPSLTDERLRINSPIAIALGRYEANTELDFAFSFTNISGEQYIIQDAIVNISDGGENIAAFTIDLPETPLTLATSGPNATFEMPIRAADIDKISQIAGDHSVDIQIIGEIDTLQFDYTYRLPSIVIERTDSIEVDINSTIPVGIEFHNFTTDARIVTDININPNDGELHFSASKFNRITIPPIGTATTQLIYTPTAIGTYSYSIGLKFDRNLRDVKDNLDFIFVVKDR